MSKQKYFVVNPWRKGQNAGDSFETENLHPSLINHVKEVGEHQDAPTDPRIAELEQLLCEAEDKRQAAEEKLLAAEDKRRAAEEKLLALSAPPAVPEPPKSTKK